MEIPPELEGLWDPMAELQRNNASEKGEAGDK